MFMTAAFFLLSFCTAQAGPQGRGGGKGIVCRSSSGQINSVQLLDLWEGQNIYGRRILRKNAPVADLVDEAIQRLKYARGIEGGEEGGVTDNGISYTPANYFVRKLKAQAQYFLAPNPNVDRLRHIELTQTPDSFEVAVPNNCKVEQIVNYIDSPHDPRILINQDLWEHMSHTDLAALIVHEAFYSLMREGNSIRVRRAVDFVFSGASFNALYSILPQKFVRCYSSSETGSDRSA